MVNVISIIMITVIITCVQSKREEPSTCWSKVQSPFLKQGRDGRSRSKAPSNNSCNNKKSIRGKKLRQKQQPLLRFRLIRIVLSIIRKQPLLIGLDQTLLVTSRTCKACILARKKRRLILVAQMWSWSLTKMKKEASSKTSLETWNGLKENEESLLTDSLI